LFGENTPAPVPVSPDGTPTADETPAEGLDLAQQAATHWAAAQRAAAQGDWTAHGIALDALDAALTQLTVPKSPETDEAETLTDPP
jgi:uncharacterized membrane protein (UPF0182 family)